ncbi:chain length determinant protein EpsF [Xylophilus sp. GOD-11R]|uniref:chain length determinant protein EpsF n=1 Tax=Xylophilus sp. GOD-11R TaxID=3089814 RepID=UPI00298D1EBA|nr:chain length determinant protein EpsF [Xylophilus sp. GOD-11R]WPB57917.1 chain length determinant protein EpsF [Xylophilus sp. GOD-11R]
MTIHQFLLILRARYKAALLTLFCTIAIAAIVTALMPRRYTATAAVMVDVKSPDPVAGVLLPGLVAPGYMATQVDIINSDRVAQRVVTLLGLDKNPEVRSQWVEATDSKGTLVSWLASNLQRNLDVRPARDSNVITIDYKTSDPDFAAAAANAFAKAYVDINLDLKVEPAKLYAAWFEEQTKVSRDKLDGAQKALYAYQQKVGIVASDDRLDFESARLNEAATQLATIQTMTTDSQSKRGAGSTVAEVMQSPLVNSLKTDIARVESKLQESSGNLGSNHPQTLRTEAELNSLKGQLNSEISRITASINTSYQVGKQRERELQKVVADQKARVIEMNNYRNELNVLRGDVAAAQREFEAVSQRAAQSRLESLSNQTNIATLSIATPPLASSSPRVLLNMLASVFVGTLLGIAVALAVELMNRRVRSTEDLAYFLELPVLASISSSSRLSGKARKLSSNPSLPALGQRSAT